MNIISKYKEECFQVALERSMWNFQAAKLNRKWVPDDRAVFKRAWILHNNASINPPRHRVENSATVWRKITINDMQNVCSDLPVEWRSVSHGSNNWWAFLVGVTGKHMRLLKLIRFPQMTESHYVSDCILTVSQQIVCIESYSGASISAGIKNIILFLKGKPSIIIN